MTRLAALVFSTWALLGGCTGPTYGYGKAGSDVADFRRVTLPRRTPAR